MAVKRPRTFQDKRIELLTLLVTALGVLFVTLGVHLRPDYHTAALLCTYFAAAVVLVVGSYLLVTYTTSGKKRQPIAREIIALTLIFSAWLLTWTATFEVYYMQPRLASSWTVLAFSYDLVGAPSPQDAELQRIPFLAADGSRVILRVTGSESYVQYAPEVTSRIVEDANQNQIALTPVRYAIELDDAPISGGPWTLNAESPRPVTIPDLAPSSYRDDMHFLRVYPVSGPYKTRLTLNCIIEIQKSSE